MLHSFTLSGALCWRDLRFRRDASGTLMCCVGITTHGDLVMKIQHMRPEIFALEKFLHAASAVSGGHILRGKNLDLCASER